MFALRVPDDNGEPGPHPWRCGRRRVRRHPGAEMENGRQGFPV